MLLLFSCEQEKEPCSGTPAVSLVLGDIAPDFSISDAVYPGMDVEPYFAGNGTVTIEAWDCVDLAWWTDVGEQKVVQVWSDSASCGYYDTVTLFVYPCGSIQGDDLLYRDLDEDGVRPIDGDCDDTNPEVGICDDASSTEDVEDTGE